MRELPTRDVPEMPEVRYEAALHAASSIAGDLDRPLPAEHLARIVYAVLEAIYAAEIRLAELRSLYLPLPR